MIATYYPKTSYCNTLIYVLKINSDIRLSYLYLLGVINSHFIGWYLRNKFQISDDDTFPQVMIRDILQIPFPYTEKSSQDKMIQLSNTMLESNKKLNTVKTPDEKEKLSRQITATDRQIDRLVYTLYGLTEDEIKIMENSNE